MRHYDRADYRHLNDGERYRDYDYLAEDGWTDEAFASSAPKSSFMAGAPASPAAPAERREARDRHATAKRPGLLRSLVHAVLHPREVATRIAQGVIRSLGIRSPKRQQA